jgi:cation diffusion facilitator CzcD-associated flavoprotein CzcO
LNREISKSGPRFAIIGGGMAGILSAIKLQQNGYDNFTIYEKAERLGGTWRENTYPGIACDVPSHSYCYEFEPNPDWSHTCSPGAEILEYFENVAEKYDVTKKVLFGAEVSTLRFENGKWHLQCEDGRSDIVEFVVAATGVLHHPFYPEISGLDSFAGPMFHTARWDHSIELEGKRVGIIGTGSSAIQIVGDLAGKVAKLVQFQRTPQWILPRANPPYSKEEKQFFRDNPDAMHEIRAEQMLMFEQGFSSAVVGENPEALARIQAATLANLEDNVKDPALREKLRPEYQAACKRLIMADNYYEAIQHPDSELVTEAIDGVEPAGVRTADGKLHELDVLVIATGFKVDRFLRPIEVVGRDDKTLEEAWAERPSAYLSVCAPGFPNLVMLNGPNGPVGNFSLIDVADIQFEFFLKLVEEVQAGDSTAFAPKSEAAIRFEAERVEATKNTVWVSGCSSWYLDDRGVPAAWPWSMQRFRATLREPDLDDFEFTA